MYTFKLLLNGIALATFVPLVVGAIPILVYGGATVWSLCAALLISIAVLYEHELIL